MELILLHVQRNTNFVLAQNSEEYTRVAKNDQQEAIDCGSDSKYRGFISMRIKARKDAIDDTPNPT
jgi:hypothetical protein